MPLFHVPRDFQRALKQYDPALRCRWSNARACYLIERKVSRGPRDPVPHDPETGTVWDPDSAQAWAQGYLIIMEVGWNALDSRVLNALYGSDLWRQGGADVVSAQIDARITAHERRTRAEFLDRVGQATRARLRYRDTVRTLSERDLHTAPPGGLSIAGN